MLEMTPQSQYLRIATVLPDADVPLGGPSTLVNYHELQWSSDRTSTPAFTVTTDELPETSFITNSTERSLSQRISIPLNSSNSKLAQASSVWAQDTSVFFSGKDPKHQSQKKKKKSSSPGPIASAVSAEDAVLVLSRNGSTDTTFKPSQYHAYKFSLPCPSIDEGEVQNEGQTYRQLLMIRQPGLQRSGPMSLTKDLGSFEKFDAIEICTGMCLFAEEDLGLCTQNATIQPRRLATLPISICEKEIITRLSITIANTAAVYIHGSKMGKSTTLRINIDIPSVQYYMNAFEAFDNGSCSSDDVLEWMAAIKNRRHLLFQAFSKAIEYGLTERGLSEADTNINLSCGLKAAGETIFCKLRTSSTGINWIDEIMNAANQDNDECWAEFLSLLDETERTPKTWRQFHTLSYMYEVAKPVLRTRSAMINTKNMSMNYILTAKSAPPSPQPSNTTQKGYFDVSVTDSSKPAPAPRILLLAIDDSDEGRIYTKSYAALCKLSTSAARSPGANSIAPPAIITRILTICPAPQIIVGTSGKNSEWSRSSLWRAQLRRGGLTESSLQFRTEQGSIETESDVLRRVYDGSLVSKIEGWLRK